MISIFYDLETTDRFFLGQILNYSFIAVDDRYEIHSELSGLIKISRLQLPSPGAILANRTDVLEHQKVATVSEKDAASRIARYLDATIKEGRGKARLIGYNSARFDLPYLRTTLIRNGINPYPKGLQHTDLIFASKKLFVSEEKFRMIAKKTEDPSAFSLSLENLSTNLGILSGVQTHESRDDVLLSIRLAQKLHSDFGLDIRDYDPYEALSAHSKPKSGKIFFMARPSYTGGMDDPVEYVPMVLLDVDHRYALWINLNRYKEGAGRGSISWFNCSGTSAFFISPKKTPDDDLKATALKALKELSKVNLANYFTDSTCDIEADIYRLDHPAREALGEAIWRGDDSHLKRLAIPALKVLYSRYKLAQYEWGSGDDARATDQLRQYAMYRYGGKAIISKFIKEGDDEQREGQTQYQESLKELMSSISNQIKVATGADKSLLLSLQEFYLKSDIMKVAGDELLQSSTLCETSAA